MESQQREAEDFVEKLLGSPFAPLVLDQVIRFKRLGDVGEIMEKRAKTQLPPAIQQMEAGDLPAEAVPQIMELAKEAQEKDSQIQALIQKLAEFEREKEAKTLDNQAKAEIERMRKDTDRQIAELKAASAEAMKAMEQRVKLALGTEQMDEDALTRSIERVEAPGPAR